MFDPSQSKRWNRLLPAFAVLLLVGCSSSASQPAEPTPTTGGPEQQTASPPAPMSAPAPMSTADIDTIRAGRFDNGKMWTFEYAPLEYFHETYGFSPDSTWFARARLGALRIPGCSASFVSPNGLVMTNHHCARESVTEVSEPGEDLLEDGFYAASLADERRAESAYADQLIALVDVTDEVHAALESATSDAQRAQVEQEASQQISARLAQEYGGEEAGIVVEITALWDGAKYSAYVFQRYSDLRLVMSPELKIAYFGGDFDNFTYPRYDLDMTFYRVYDEEGQPLRTDYYFPLNNNGTREGDAVFVIGNPGGSSRLQTVAQLDFRRLALDKVIVEFLSSQIELLQEFNDADPEAGAELELRTEILSLQNQRKAYRGMWEGLHDPAYMARRRDTERQFLTAIESDSALNAQYSGLIERMAGIQEEKLELAADYGAFIALGNPSYTSAVMRRGIFAYQYVMRRDSGAPNELLSRIQDAISSIGDQPSELQQGLLTTRLRYFERYLGADSQVGAQIFQGRSPEATADAILSESPLADSAATADALTAGTLTMEDPAIQVASAVMDRFFSYQERWQDLLQQEAGVTASLGRARFDVYGATIPPDATFSLRIADGIVKGYEYNGTVAPTHTTFYGLYDHYYSYGADSDWDLPERWLDPPGSFDLSKPLNFVITADVIGGNSGSPVINSDLQAVGLIFDGNIESLPGDYIYDPERNRSVAVDVRGILEALDEIYGADRIVLELTTGELARSE